MTVQRLKPLLFLFASSLCFPQQINLQMQTPVPQAPTVNTQVRGNAGNASYGYYVVVNYSGGAVTSQVSVVNFAPVPLSGSNYVNVGWVALAGAVTYDVLRLLPGQTFTGSCICSVATGLTTTNVNDTGGTLSSYTIGTGAVSDSGTLYVNNRD